MILDWAARGNRFEPQELAEIRLEKPVDLRQLKPRWLLALKEARDLIAQLPPEELGCLYLDARGQPVKPDPRAPDFKKLIRHYGSLKGAWPRIVES